jgi:hypothetical protein
MQISRTTHPSDVWVLKAVFGASLTALIAFWVLMLVRGPGQGDSPALRRCHANQDVVRGAFRALAERRGQDFPALIAGRSKGATVGPLFELLREEKLVDDVPPHTDECRSWKDYTVVDAQAPSIEKVQCRIHGRGSLSEAPAQGGSR